MLACLMLSVSGCAKNTPVSDYCLIAKPIYFHPDDEVTVRTETAIITHTATWEKSCLGRDM